MFFEAGSLEAVSFEVLLPARTFQFHSAMTHREGGQPVFWGYVVRESRLWLDDPAELKKPFTRSRSR